MLGPIYPLPNKEEAEITNIINFSMNSGASQILSFLKAHNNIENNLSLDAFQSQIRQNFHRSKPEIM
jgi:hypothetical protein